MAYEVFKSTGPGVTHGRGVASIARNGRGRFHPDDLNSVGISDHATILIDKKRMRFAIRAPKEGESPRRVTNYAGTRSHNVWIGGALLAMGLRASEVAGAYEVEIEDGVISIDLSDSET